jgi:outer membrane protein assembly factor BamB
VLAVVVAVAVIGSPGNAAKTPWRSLVLISAATGKVDRSFPHLAVTDAVADGRSGWFAAVGRRIVRLSSGGRVDRSWHTQLGGKLVQHIARSGTRLYVNDSRRIYAIDTRTGGLLWSSATPARVQAIAAAGESVYIAATQRDQATARRKARSF